MPKKSPKGEKGMGGIGRRKVVDFGCNLRKGSNFEQFGRYGAWHLQRRAKVQEAKMFFFNGHFAKFLGPRFRTAGGQGGSRKHCAIPFRPAAKRQLEN